LGLTPGLLLFPLSVLVSRFLSTPPKRGQTPTTTKALVSVPVSGPVRKSNGPIAIADFDKGVERLGPLRNGGRAIVLMCGCPDVNTCHRKVLPERPAQRWGAEVVHLTPPPKVKPSPVSQSSKSLF
jgi:hypothetical protein